MEQQRLERFWETEAAAFAAVAPKYPMDEQLSNQAATLGGLIRTINMLLAGRTSSIGNGWRMNLRAPRELADGSSVEHCEAWLLPATPAEVGELLWVDDNLIDHPSARRLLRIFLSAAFEPPVVGGGKVGVIFDDGREGIIFVQKETKL